MNTHITLLVTVFRFAQFGFVTGKITEAEVNGNQATIKPDEADIPYTLHHGEWRLATDEEIASLSTPEAVEPANDTPPDPVGVWDVDAGAFLDAEGAVIQPDTNIERKRRGLPTLHVDPATPPTNLTGEPETEIPDEDAPTGKPDAEGLMDETGPMDEADAEADKANSATDQSEQPSASSEEEQN